MSDALELEDTAVRALAALKRLWAALEPDQHDAHVGAKLRFEVLAAHLAAYWLTMVTEGIPPDRLEAEMDAAMAHLRQGIDHILADLEAAQRGMQH
jgi:hypothetical protein